MPYNTLKRLITQKVSISKKLGPNTILLGKPGPDFNMKGIFFGYYDMVYIDTANTLKIRSIPNIVLRESNEDGGHL